MRDGYPLPWCELLDVPYWVVNLHFIDRVEGWKELQRGKSMAELIPLIDQILAKSDV